MDNDFITAAQAAERLGRSASQVRRYAQHRQLNAIKVSGRLHIRVDEYFASLERAQPASSKRNLATPLKIIPLVQDAAAGAGEQIHELVEENLQLRERLDQVLQERDVLRRRVRQLASLVAGDASAAKVT